MARIKVTEEELDLLTEEERVGLREHQAEIEAELAAEEREIAAAAAGDPEGDLPVGDPEDYEIKPGDPKPDPEEPDEPELEPEDDEELPPVEDDDAEEPAEDDEDDEPVDTSAAMPILPAHRLSKSEESRIGEIDKLLDSIADKFDEGEITAREMREQQKALVSELDALKDKRTIAKVATQTNVDQWYGATIPLFLAQHTEYKEGSLRHKLLDGVVRELQAKSSNPTDPKILFDAHKMIIAELGEIAAAEEEKPAKKKVNGNGKTRRESPPNFNQIPASDQTQVTPSNKFARLDRLKGVDYEHALARLSPADRDFYLQGGG